MNWLYPVLSGYLLVGLLVGTLITGGLLLLTWPRMPSARAFLLAGTSLVVWPLHLAHGWAIVNNYLYRREQLRRIGRDDR